MPVLVEGYVKREKTLQEELTQKKNELAIFKQLETYKKDSDIHIFSPNLVFEKDTKTLRYREKIVKLTLQQQQLLAAFCNAPENTCSINDLCNLVWKSCVVEENTIHQAISRLNNTLKNQELYIQYEFKDSYKLIFKGNGLPAPCQS
ncbi:winged helix-turn-helix domain-containing protein [Parabacteroides faecis]|nr:winged helix-turn-helix domain-containing protein [Parabacteroides faecis]MCS2890734.1 winged helix-turn-helix domain-containing protein [Parabacteroides faecis]